MLKYHPNSFAVILLIFFKFFLDLAHLPIALVIDRPAASMSKNFLDTTAVSSVPMCSMKSNLDHVSTCLAFLLDSR